MNTSNTFSNRIKDLLTLASIICGSIVAVTTVLFFVFTTYTEWRNIPSVLEEISKGVTQNSMLIENNASAIESNANSISALLIDSMQQSRIITILQAPSEVATWSASTRALGPCSISSRKCNLVLIARRNTGAESCSIIHENIVQFFVSKEDGIKRPTMLTTGSSFFNVGTDFEAVNISVLPPRDMPLGDAHYFVEFEYENCAWQTDGSPRVYSESPAIPIEFIP